MSRLIRESLKTWLSQSSNGYLHASMLPNACFTDNSFYEIDMKLNPSKFNYIGHCQQLTKEGDYVSTDIGNVPIIVVKKEDTTKGFVNVCQHRAATILDPSGVDGHSCLNTGGKIRCQYHGWEYNLDGRLTKAVKLSGVSGFKAKDISLAPITLKFIGPFIFGKVEAHNGNKTTFEDDYPNIEEELFSGITASDYNFVTRKTYNLSCNWKVFADNYLDGGYHVSTIHTGLTSQLDMKSYYSKIFKNYSVQFVGSKANSPETELVGKEVPGRIYGVARYAWLFPATAINIYGPWIDVHIVKPVTANSCTVNFDYFLNKNANLSEEEIEKALKASDTVQQEDIKICQQVQTGLESGQYRPGRYGATEELSFDFGRTYANEVLAYVESTN